ncbi:Trk system potassium transporter TrkA [Marinobacterium sp. D7]|uniref:Trk system potassium transporter TrkA n=1 Tax=Marinobacterium ramblicola TaxID=2849041 RepID=UPI001C2DBEBB|nr:Trk system potassium transporter TrkA [Marinobacterium ramblicola]MBV1788431.1 Trk system potassium transporter TrkA [Marinobacterium ramblicola]
MRIIILGAGQVGATLAEKLSSEDNDITVVDSEVERLRLLQDRLDIRTLEGVASHPSVLEQAGCADSDMLIAVTGSDEINMVACQVASTLFNTPRKIARIRSPQYQQYATGLFGDDAVPVDVLISPEQLVTAYMEQLLDYPGATELLDFADGRVKLVSIRVDTQAPLYRRRLSELSRLLGEVRIRVVAIYRLGEPIHIAGGTCIEAGDELFFLVAADHVQQAITRCRGELPPYGRILIAGGGNIGKALAQRLEARHSVTVIERNIARCNQITAELTQTVVVNGSASAADLLEAEGIDRVDLFCALTNDDEANIMASMLAKRMGARKVMTIINNPAYIELVEGGVIDIAISPQQITIGGLLTYVRRGEMARIHSLRHGTAEALEGVARGNGRNSRLVGRRIVDLPQPAGVVLGAVVREGQVLIAKGELRIVEGDHLIFFMTNKQSLGAVEKLFQVGLALF